MSVSGWDDSDDSPVWMVISLVLAGLLMALALAYPGPACAAPPDGRGNTGAETRSTEKPDNPRGFGSVTSQRAVEDHDIGTHVSGQSTPHLGVGNVAANDGALFTLSGTTDTGTRPGDHAVAIGALSGYDPTVRPGTHE